MTWKIDMGLYNVTTDSNVPQILEYGRSAAGFINVTDCTGKHWMLNVRSIVSVQQTESAKTDDVIGEIVDSVFGAFGLPPAKKKESETIVIEGERDDGEA